METGETRIMNTETQGKIPINTTLTAEKTQNKAQILSPKTGALSVLSYPPILLCTDSKKNADFNLMYLMARKT
jgi:hypothetical protein